MIINSLVLAPRSSKWRWGQSTMANLQYVLSKYHHACPSILSPKPETVKHHLTLKKCRGFGLHVTHGDTADLAFQSWAHACPLSTPLCPNRHHPSTILAIVLNQGVDDVDSWLPGVFSILGAPVNHPEGHICSTDDLPTSNLGFIPK